MKKITSYFIASLAAVSILAGGFVPQLAKAESTPEDPARTAEYQIMAQYVMNAPRLPLKKAKGTFPTDAEAIKTLVTADETATSYAEARSLLSSKSVEMFDRTPLFISDLAALGSGHTYTISKVEKPKFLKGLEYAKVKVKVKNERNKKSDDNYIVVKENGVWKIDYVQMLKKQVMKYLR